MLPEDVVSVLHPVLRHRLILSYEALADRVSPDQVIDELLRQPGAVRDVSVSVVAASIDVAHERLTGDVSAAIRLVALNDGIEASGTVSAPWSTVCRRCLAEIDGVAHMSVATWVDDAWRQNDVVIGGRTVLRFPQLAVRLHPDRVIAQTTAALVRRGWRPGLRRAG